MDQVKHYRSLLKQILRRHMELAQSLPHSEMESLFILDEERDHYAWLRAGWTQKRRTLAVMLLVRLREGKFWIEEDWTEAGIATELVQAGVPPHDIVLAFQPPETRTEVAAA